MLFLSGSYLWLLWAVVIVIFLVIESLTVGLQAVWYAIGALAALVASLFQLAPWIQLVLFLCGAVVQIIVTPPIPSHFSPVPDFSFRASPLAGMTGVAQTEIPSDVPGSIEIGGKIFPAVVEEGTEAIPSGAAVVVIGLGDECLVVSRQPDEAETKE